MCCTTMSPTVRDLRRELGARGEKTSFGFPFLERIELGFPSLEESVFAARKPCADARALRARLTLDLSPDPHYREQDKVGHVQEPEEIGRYRAL